MSQGLGLKWTAPLLKRGDGSYICYKGRLVSHLLLPAKTALNGHEGTYDFEHSASQLTRILLGQVAG